MREMIFDFIFGCIGVVCLYVIINVFVPDRYKKSFLVFAITFNILILPLSIIFAGYGIFSSPDIFTGITTFLGSFLIVQIVPLILYFVSLACYSFARKRLMQKEHV